jgi:hypothetical protein
MAETREPEPSQLAETQGDTVNGSILAEDALFFPVQ